MGNRKVYIWVTAVLWSVSVFAQNEVLPNVAASILQEDLQKHVRTIASDAMQGRQSGTGTAFRCAEYIARYFHTIHLQKPYDNNSYYQFFVTDSAAGVNVIGFIEGRNKKDEALVISAHFDHLGMYNGVVYNGADDNASGVAAMLEIAEAFSMMEKNRFRPLRSVVFIAFDAKEKELAGSAYYTAHPLFPLDKTFADLNIDAVGRIEGSPNGMADYLLLVGVNRITPDIKNVSDSLNRLHRLHLYLDDSFYDSEVFADIFYRFSDQYHFGKHDIPVVYYTGGLHDDLYKPTDTEDRIHYGVLRKRTQLIFYTAWELANRPTLSRYTP